MKMIYVECKPEAVLAKSLGIPKRKLIHEGGRDKICNRLRKQKNSKGVIDEDPGSPQHPYLKEVKPVKELSEYEIKMLHDKSRDNYLIVLCPKLEDWILKAAKEIGVDMGKYNLPDSSGELHRIINIKLDKFERFVENFRDSKRLRALGELLRN